MGDPVLHVAELVRSTGQLPAAALPPTREQELLIQGKSTASQPFTEQTALIRIFADAECAIAVGEDPEATTSNYPVGAKAEAYFYVPVGFRIAVISR
jgi:hypothetical protein